MPPSASHGHVCQHRLWTHDANQRTLTTLGGVTPFTLPRRRCPHPACPRFQLPYRPEAAAHFALPHQELGRDVIALVGRRRYAEHRSLPQSPQELTRWGVVLAPRTATNLLDRYHELPALATADP